MPLVNQVYAVEESRYRILWKSADQVVWIDVDDPKAWPISITLSELEDLILGKVASLAEDPFLELTLRVVLEGSKAWKMRQEGMETLAPFIDDFRMFDRSYRGKAVREMVAASQTSFMKVNKFLRRYWQRGMCPNALLPDYKNSGALGQKRRGKDKKLGRPRSSQPGQGSNLSEDTKRIFRTVIDQKVLAQQGISLADAHVRCVGLLLASNPDLASEDAPTYRQFTYFYHSEYGHWEKIRKRMSDIDFDKDVRPILSSSAAETLGPGYRYQIDATIGDIYLVSEEDTSKVVGRPVIYFVIDVFSRMVTGMYVGFEGPSWVSAMMALSNTISDKVEYCKSLGIDIQPEDWPVQGLPEAILADKGEFNGTRVEAFAEAFGVRIENAIARRGDAKGIVERLFRTAQGNFKPYFSGVVMPEISKKKGGEDYRRQANLTLTEFTKSIVAMVLYHNNYKVIEKYDRCEGMPEDLPAVPVMLWNWGIQTLTGRLRDAPAELVYINLMPHEKATVSDAGIKLFGCFYSCSEALKAGWFLRKQGLRPQKVTVAYDPRSADHIYVRPDNSLKAFWVCDLTDKSRRFRGKSFWDVWQQTAEERKADAAARQKAVGKRSDLLKTIDEIAASANTRGKQLESGLRSDLGKRIKENKQAEKDVERQKTAFRPTRPKPDKGSKVIDMPTHKNQSFRYPNKHDLLFGEGEDDE